MEPRLRPVCGASPFLSPVTAILSNPNKTKRTNKSKPKTQRPGKGVKVKGNGDYKAVLEGIKSLARRIPKGTFSTGGRLAGAALGGLVNPQVASFGGSLGGALGEHVSRITGFGDYSAGGSRSGPSFKAGNRPTFSGNDMSVRVRFSEFVTTLNGSTGFNQCRMAINPGNAGLFPWLSSFAHNYEQYRLRGCIFHFEPTSGSIAGLSPALGSVMMATQYDVQDLAFASESELLNYVFASTAVPCTFVNHAVECDRRQTQAPILKVSHGPLPNTATPQLYNFGNFTVATVGQQSVYTLGQLYVTYDVEFFKPKLIACIGPEYASMRWINGMASTAAVAFNGTSAQYDAKSNLPLVYCNVVDSAGLTPVSTYVAPVVQFGRLSNPNISSVNALTFMRRGYYQVAAEWWSGTASMTGDPTWGPQNCVVIQDASNTATTNAPHIVAEGQYASWNGIVFVDKPGGRLMMTCPTSTASDTMFNITVQCMPQGLATLAGDGKINREFIATYPLALP